ncbi:M14 family murein peptide amidase A [Bacteriovorax sp. Seq25_V]|uniref:M14 family murein peptide amidase A n=1 Tax=Bacteriovorax sp. Seq25_V TaxID=1201288 RepID=UPI000389DE16|nr:M14 family murein peptide amidase A [Bacteriovorax sp. Seq25_V]EQC46241.1 zinc carboxypeptidase [Bacteriovorax sp. Seq25_V]
MKKFIALILIFILAGCSNITPIENPITKTEEVNVSVEKTESPLVKPILSEVEKVEFVKVPETKAVSDFCTKIESKFHHYGWGRSHCDSFSWNHVRNSVLGDPLIWAVYGDEDAHKEEPRNMTLIMCGVHGDEITPIKFCFDILHHLYQKTHTELGKQKLKDNLIVVAPIVSPDSFFKKRPTRTNARGVDVNRNFPTKDWSKSARKLWASRYGKDKRRDPGKTSMSEPETLFQVNLIKRYNPTKIISVHAPLTILDYDGPTMAHKHFHEIGSNAENLLDQMSKMAKGYTVKNYPFFPGSLGNYAGNERNIPTITLELPSSDNRKHKEYWEQFKLSIDYAIFHSSLKKSNLVMSEKNNEEESGKKN